VTLLDDLQAVVPEDEHEERAKRRIVAHVAGGGALFERTRWDGHLTGSAFVVDAAGERLLLLFHRKLERWLQPGGHGEPAETDPLAVARREAEEETGIAGLLLHPEAPAPFDLDVHEIPARHDEPAHEHLDVRYLFVAPEDARPEPQAAEVRGFSWVPLAEAMKDGADPSVARAAAKIARLVQMLRTRRRG
jgi:8-oxo-dGTP pyrophosphatase MutT (NUDIX family)